MKETLCSRPRCTLPQSKQLSRLQRLGRGPCFSSSIFISSNLRPRAASARVREGCEPGGLIHRRGEGCLLKVAVGILGRDGWATWCGAGTRERGSLSPSDTPQPPDLGQGQGCPCIDPPPHPWRCAVPGPLTSSKRSMMLLLPPGTLSHVQRAGGVSRPRACPKESAGSGVKRWLGLGRHLAQTEHAPCLAKIQTGHSIILPRHIREQLGDEAVSREPALLCLHF